MRAISPELQLGRRQLARLKEYELIEDLQWNNSLNAWILHFTLTCDIPPHDYMPAKTNWYAVISSSYPFGKIKFYPDKNGGVIHTFQHQAYNKPSTKFPWREGDICINTPLIKWGRELFKEEPMEPHARLKWHMERTISWITAAAKNELTITGEPFELPPLPGTESCMFIFNEDKSSFDQWVTAKVTEGTFTFKPIKNQGGLYAITGFAYGKEAIKYKWGNYINDFNGKESTGIFVMLKSVPVNAPWEIPAKWKDFFEAAGNQGIEIENILHDLYVKHRKLGINWLAIGFPVTDVMGAGPTRMHWFNVRLEIPKTLKGFRDQKSMYQQIAKIIFAKDKTINWQHAENWNKEQITSRGGLNKRLQQQRILFIGAGAVGSLLSEMLVRLGCSDTTIIDADIAEVGNFSRHDLTMESVGMHKAESLAARLNSIFPFITARSINKPLQSALRNEKTFLYNYDLIIDATGDDELIQLVSDHLSDVHAFISVSTGIKARRLFCYMRDEGQPECLHADFNKLILPWLIKEKKENEGLQLSREGVGCWHPVFPARLDDITMLLGAAVKIIESQFCENKFTGLVVIEKKLDANDQFIGMDIIK